MPSAAISSFGTLLKIGDGQGSETFATIAEVTELKPPSLKLDTEDVTNHSSTGGWEEVIPTIKSGGEVGLKINFIPTNATHSYSAGLLKDFNNKTKRNFQIVFPDGSNTTWSFAAYVTAFKADAPVKGKLSADITLKVTGQPTLA
jgi:predicted secreted protein